MDTTVVTHTPGPWSIHRMSDPSTFQVTEGPHRFDYRSVHIGVGDKLIATALMWTAGERGGYPRVDNVEEQDANAALIAAAPDLLAALKALVENDEINLWVGGNPNVTNAVVERALAVIAKAEGR